MIDPTVQNWLAATGARMIVGAESGDPRAMYEIIAEVAGRIDRYVTPARLATERVTLENEGILL
jgi:hypothetical protein